MTEFVTAAAPSGVVVVAGACALVLGVALLAHRAFAAAVGVLRRRTGRRVAAALAPERRA